MEKPKEQTIAVIIPTYNRAALLAESLKSIANQSRLPDQVVVVDDGSTDKTDAVVEGIRREYFAPRGLGEFPAFRYIRQKVNGGKSIAANVGILSSESDIVWIFDDDDIADPKRIETIMPAFEDDGVDVVHTAGEWRDVIETKPDGTISGDWTARRPWEAVDVPSADMLRWFMTGCRWFGISVAWRRSILGRLAELERLQFGMKLPSAADWTEYMGYRWPFDPVLGRAQDYDMWIRLLWAGAKVVAINERTVYARIHDGRRGPGHKYKNDQVDDATAQAEKIIFDKVWNRIPVDTIWPNPNPTRWIERAYAVFIRGLWIEAAHDMERAKDVDPGDVNEDHLRAVLYMIDASIRALPENGADVLAAAKTIREAAIDIRNRRMEHEGIDPSVAAFAGGVA